MNARDENVSDLNRRRAEALRPVTVEDLIASAGRVSREREPDEIRRLRGAIYDEASGRIPSEGLGDA